MTIIRKTKSLSRVLEIFENSSKAFSAIELCSYLKSEMNKSTIYRTLERLEKSGFLHSFQGKGRLKLYCKNQSCVHSNEQAIHPHFQCRVCEKVDCVDVNIDLPNFPSRKVEDTHFLIVGVCETCI
jgi:Fur family ferric uptake transcriptional regulator